MRRRWAPRWRRQLPQASFTAPQGGYFLWVDLPEGSDVAAMFDAAAERGVQFVKGTDFMLDGGESSFRLAFSGVTPGEIEEGVGRLADAARSAGVGDISAARRPSGPSQRP